MCDLISMSDCLFRAETERLAAERLLEEAKALIEDARLRVDRDETEVREYSGQAQGGQG